MSEHRVLPHQFSFHPEHKDPPTGAQLDILGLILQELKSINNKMDSVETAATHNKHDFVKQFQDAFDEGCEHGANPPDEPEIMCTAPELKDTSEELQRELQKKIDRRTEFALHQNEAKERFEETSNLLSEKSNNVLPTFKHVAEVKRIDGDYYYIQHPFCGKFTVDLGLWRQLSNDFSIANQGVGAVPLAHVRAIACAIMPKALSVEELDALTSEASRCVDDSPLEEELELSPFRPQAETPVITQWRKDVRAWHSAGGDDEVPVDAEDLLIQASKLIRTTQFKLEAALKREKQQGLQDPSKFKPADGERFIIQYIDGVATIVEVATYHAENDIFRLPDFPLNISFVQAMVPFPESVKVDRSSE